MGLLAGSNDLEQVALTGEGREINRHNYTLEEIEAETQREVVQRLMKLIRFRNTYSAFGGTFRVLEAADHEIRLMWEHGGDYCRLFIDLQNYQTVIEYVDEQGQEAVYRV